MSTVAPSPSCAIDARAIVDLVRAADVAAGVADVLTGRFVEVSDTFLRLVGRERAAVVDQLIDTLFPGPEAAEALALAGTGLVRAFELQVAMVRPDGSPVDVVACARRVEGTDLVVGVIGEVEEPAVDLAAVTTGGAILAVLDERLSIVEVSPDVVELVAVASVDDVVGRSIFDLTHREEHTELLITFGRVLGARRSASLRLRVRARGSWVLVRATVGVLTDAPGRRFAVVLEPVVAGDIADRVDLLDRLRRIALEVLAARVVAEPDASSRLARLPGADGLTERQREIAVRVLEGARVRSIARDLDLGPSTVRNHLAAIYSRLGVDSQADLLRRAAATRHGR